MEISIHVYKNNENKLLGIHFICMFACTCDAQISLVEWTQFWVA